MRKYNFISFARDIIIAAIALIVVWNLVGILFVSTKQLTHIDGGFPILFVPDGKTKIYCNGKDIATFETNNIKGMSWAETEININFENGETSKSYICDNTGWSMR